jgi:hypothetical protein
VVAWLLAIDWIKFSTVILAYFALSHVFFVQMYVSDLVVSGVSNIQSNTGFRE